MEIEPEVRWRETTELGSFKWGAGWRETDEIAIHYAEAVQAANARIIARLAELDPNVPDTSKNPGHPVYWTDEATAHAVIGEILVAGAPEVEDFYLSLSNEAYQWRLRTIPIPLDASREITAELGRASARGGVFATLASRLDRLRLSESDRRLRLSGALAFQLLDDLKRIRNLEANGAPDIFVAEATQHARRRAQQTILVADGYLDTVVDQVSDEVRSGARRIEILPVPFGERCDRAGLPYRDLMRAWNLEPSGSIRLSVIEVDHGNKWKLVSDSALLELARWADVVREECSVFDSGIWGDAEFAGGKAETLDRFEHLAELARRFERERRMLMFWLERDGF